MPGYEWIPCKCGFFMPPDYDRCDICLTSEYSDMLGYGRSDSMDHLGTTRLYDEENVLSAIRKAEKKGG